MTYDPFGEDLDADIFADEPDETEEHTPQESHPEDIENGNGYRHRIDGEICSTCNVAHGDGSVYRELPSVAVEALLKLLDSMPDHIVHEIFNEDLGLNSRREADLLTTFMKYTENQNRKNKDGPLLQAIMEFLDAQSNGAVSARWRVYEAERKLVVSHKILKNVNGSLEEARGIEEASPVFLSLLELVLDIANERVMQHKQAYLEAAYSADYKIHDEILESGTYPEDYAEDKSDLVHDFILK